MADLVFLVKNNARGGRLAQCNVDLYVSQFYTDTDLLLQMMDRNRARFYRAARTWAHSQRVAEHLPGDDILAGVLALSAYCSICNFKYTPQKYLAQVHALVKDRIQPLPKIGPGDLVRMVLNNVQRGAFVNIAQRLVAGDVNLQGLGKNCSASYTRDTKLEGALQADFSDWFIAPKRRYQLGNVMAQAAMMGSGAKRKDNLLTGLLQWDTVVNDQVTVLGTNLWWGGDENFSPGTPTGKPVLPKLLNGLPGFLVEARQTREKFNKAHWEDIA